MELAFEVVCLYMDLDGGGLEKLFPRLTGRLWDLIRLIRGTDFHRSRLSFVALWICKTGHVLEDEGS